MGKRSNFERIKKDKYMTWDKAAILPLVPHIDFVDYMEPCAGDGSLIRNLSFYSPKCRWSSDIEPDAAGYAYGIKKHDALLLNNPFGWPIVTNPPWERRLLHPMIDHFMNIAPFVWLLFDADWAHTLQSSPYIKHIEKIVSVGRVKWIPGTTMCGKDNCAWYKFRKGHVDGPKFYGRSK